MRRSHLTSTLGILASWLASCESAPSGSMLRAPSFETARAAPRPAITTGARTSSALALVHVGRTLVAYVADEDDRALRVIDVDDARELSVFPLPGAPAQVVTLPNARIAVTLRDVSAVAILEGAGTHAWPMRSVAYLDVPPEPIALARTADDATLVVTSGWGHALTAFATADFARRFVVDLGREPRGVAMSEDGARAYVAHAAGDALSIVELAHPESAPKVWRLEAETWTPGFRAMLEGPFSRKSNNAHAVVLSEEPRGRIFVPHALSHTSATPGFAEEQAPTGYGGAGAGPNDVFDVAVVDEAKATPMDFERNPNGETVRMASDDVQCLVPSAAIAMDAKLFVACMDTNRIVELDAGWFRPMDMTTRTFAVPSGPTGIALDRDGDRVVVWSKLARKVTLLPASSTATFTLASFDVPALHALDAQVARGREIFFHRDVRVSGDGRVCASCHPDGRDDGLVWMTSEGPRQTPMLAGRLEGSAPYGWRGASADIATHLTKTFARLNGTGVTGTDEDALVAFLRSMPSPKSRRTDTAVAARGKAIFESERAGCASCHGVGGDMPDGDAHNVRSWARGDVLGVFDTPSLRSVSGTAPYFHDGRYKDLHTLLSSVDGTMGHTKYLSASDLSALETYLKTL